MPLTRSSSEAEEVSVSEQSVEAAVSLTSLAHETSQSDVVVLSGHLAVFVALSDLNLDRGVVLGGDQSVGGRALAGDIEIHNISFVVLQVVL